MYFHLTNTQVIIGGFALILIIIFALATFFENRCRKAAPLCDFGSDHNPNSPLQSSGRDNKDRSSNLHTRFADLSATGLGTAEQRISFRGKTLQNQEGD